MPQPQVKVEQAFNPKKGCLISGSISDGTAVRDEDEYIYKVLQLKNRTIPAIGSYLRECEVKDLIAREIDVTVVSCSNGKR